MNKLNDTNIFYKNALNKMMREENIDDIKIYCMHTSYLFIYIFLYFIVSYKNVRSRILYTLYTHGRENLYEPPIFVYIIYML